MEPKIISQTPVTLSEMKTEIESIRKRDKEPSVRVTKMEDYLNAFSPLAKAKEKELFDALSKLEIPRLREEFICKIIDLLPKTVDDLKVVIQGYVISVSNENLQKIVDTVNSVAK